MNMETIKKHIEQGTFIPKVKEKIHIKILTILTNNKNLAIHARQCFIRNKLKKKYMAVLNSSYDNLESCKSNKVWFCWFQGYDNAPELIKACYNSVKTAMPEREIVFLTIDNYLEYIDFPDYIKRNFEKGRIGMAHYSDLLRVALLCKYGGLWIDATVLCTCPDMAKFISELPLFVFKQADLTREDIQPIVASSWLISADSNNKILLLTRDLLYAYWKNHTYIMDYFLFHIFFGIATEKYVDLWNDVPTFYNVAPHTMQFELNNEYNEKRWNQLISISGFHKLNHHNNYQGENTLYGKVLSEYMNEVN